MKTARWKYQREKLAKQKRQWLLSEGLRSSVSIRLPEETLQQLEWLAMLHDATPKQVLESLILQECAP